MVKLLLLSILLHTIDDFVLQPVCLSNLKQKKFWPIDYLYRNDYKVALGIHGLSWSIMISLPYFVISQGWLLLIVCLVNAVIHSCVDDLKANKKKLNLVQDQSIHFAQIILTNVIFNLA